MVNALLIIGMQLLLVPLTTLRMMFVVKGQSREAAVFAVFEALIYVISLGIVFSDLENKLNMLAYAIGFSGGIYLGGLVEKKLAIGYRAINVSLLEKNDELVEKLRNDGFGVTVFEGEGMDNEKRYRLDIIAKRNREKELMALLHGEAPKAFVVVYEPTNFKGGYLVKNMKKRMKEKEALSTDVPTDKEK
ncbi:hypothetical protein CN918_31955 [Priestia megaterium]|nr:hypothetical protein CN918_31955 [Priestia megaterium]